MCVFKKILLGSEKNREKVFFAEADVFSTYDGDKKSNLKIKKKWEFIF